MGGFYRLYFCSGDIPDLKFESYEKNSINPYCNTCLSDIGSTAE